MTLTHCYSQNIACYQLREKKLWTSKTHLLIITKGSIVFNTVNTALTLKFSLIWDVQPNISLLLTVHVFIES